MNTKFIRTGLLLALFSTHRYNTALSLMFLFISDLNHAGLLNGNLTEHDAVNFVLKNNSSQSDNASVVFQTYHASENISLFNQGKI